jgi:hypothetical protein
MCVNLDMQLVAILILFCSSFAKYFLHSICKLKASVGVSGPACANGIPNAELGQLLLILSRSVKDSHNGGLAGRLCTIYVST